MHHIYREGSRATEFLASLVGFDRHINPPNGLGNIVMEDMVKMALSRMVGA